MNLDLVRTLIERPEWMADANCRGTNVTVFFPGENTPVTAAREMCRRCDVQAECLAYAINNNERHGVWGGRSERQRRTLRRGAIAQCGTVQGYLHHLRLGQTPCDPCTEKHESYNASRRRGGAA